MKGGLIADGMKLFNILQKRYGGRGYGKYLPMRWFYNNILPLMMRSEIEYEGGKLYIGEKDTAGYSFIPYEVHEREVMRKQIKKGDYVIDLGANVGFYTLLFSKWVGPEGKVFAFEPEEKNFNILCQNVMTNHYKNCVSNVYLFKLAVSSKKGSSRLYLSDKLGEHSLSVKGRFFQRIQSDRIDNIFKEKKIDFIKMDIEGWEGHALQGMKETIKANPQLKLFSEFSPNLLMQSGINSEEYYNSLKKLGFHIHWINQNKNIRKLNKSSLDSTNMLCVRK